MAMIGKPLLPWQRNVIRDAYGVRADGKWASYEVCVLCCRQQGKGVIFETQELFGLFMLREQRIIHSAHLFDTSREAFERLVDLIDGSDWLTKRVARINRAHGKEGVELTRAAGGAALKYKARTLHGTRGFTGERVILDEAYALTAGQMQAILPILATLPNPQISYGSSPPDDKTGPMPSDAMLPSIRRRGLDGDPRMCFHEWSPVEGFDPEDIEVAYATNPSLGHLVDEEYLRDQLRIFRSAGKLASFSTEHLGAWPRDAKDLWRVVSRDDWQDAEDITSRAVGQVVFACYVTPESTHTAVSAAGLRADGDIHAEVVDHRQGSTWALGRLVELCARWSPRRVVLCAGAAGGLLADLTAELAKLDLAVEVVVMRGSKDDTAAFAMLRNGLCTEPDTEAPPEGPAVDLVGDGVAVTPVTPRRVRVYPSATPGVQAALSQAVASASTRWADGGKAWQWRSSDDLSTLLSLTASVWGLVTAPAVEKKRVITGRPYGLLPGEDEAPWRQEEPT